MEKNTYLICRFLFCMPAGKAPVSLISLFKKNSDYHSYNTRIANLFYIPSAKLNASKTGIKYRSATIWNRIALEEISLEVSEAVFKKILIRMLNSGVFWNVFSCRLTISRSSWHVRHFVSMHMIKDVCIRFGAHKPNWVLRSLCFTKLCLQCDCYFNLMLYTALCLFVKCNTCNSYGNKMYLIWLWRIKSIGNLPCGLGQ